MSRLLSFIHKVTNVLQVITILEEIRDELRLLNEKINQTPSPQNEKADQLMSVLIDKLTGGLKNGD